MFQGMQEREKCDYGSASAYAAAVRKWVADTQAWNNMHHTAMTQLYMSMAHTYPPQQPSIVIVPAQQLNVIRTRRYAIPSFFRRFAAEVVDCIFAFALKMMFVFALVELEILDLSRYEKLISDQADLQTLIDITQDLFPLELLGKFICGILEAYAISFGFGTLPPGQTPGKRIFGIKVISCLSVSPLPGDPSQIDVTGMDTVPPKKSLLRSLIKNLLVNSLIPLSSVAYAFNHNRAVYDIATQTMVVFA